ncbi:Pyridoxal kinase [Porphyridium purpureum]|uniref:pyridoxal kinase n=1 Tax=Porphyridium purpureum TaxID=35688 RepID=A0A5J4YX13_PORPP|nr:Pyridoxal kinase [Porphyridium purpureum]|eukprot:POR6940..scf209_3
MTRTAFLPSPGPFRKCPRSVLSAAISDRALRSSVSAAPRKSRTLLSMQGGKADGTHTGRAAAVPTDVAQLTREMEDALRQAIEDGTKRMSASWLIPGLNYAIENTVAYNEKLLFDFARAAVCCASTHFKEILVMYSSTGTAAAASAYHFAGQAMPEHASLCGMTMRELEMAGVAGDSSTLHCVVAPKNLRGDSVIRTLQDMIQRRPDATWLLLNPQLEDQADTPAIGIREIEARREFLATFRTVYYFRPLFRIKRPTLVAVETGVLYGKYKDEWRLFQCVKGEYYFVAAFASCPSKGEISSSLERAPTPRRASDAVLAQTDKDKPWTAAEAEAIQVLLGLSLFTAARQSEASEHLLSDRAWCAMATGNTIGLGQRVLSVQSHVVSGYVGNKAAVFPLQLLGFDVDVINSVQFSNHTGYEKKWTGTRMSGQELDALVLGMGANGLLGQITHLLTGYIGSESFLEAIVALLDTLEKQCDVQNGSTGERNRLSYVCDPVLGDNGKLYVPEALIEIYRTRVICRASILTPNAFELELLAQTPIRTAVDVFTACGLLHERHGVPRIVVTSVDDIEEGKLMVFTSERRKRGSWAQTSFEVDRLPCTFTGSGDLSAALILARSCEFPNSLRRATELAMASVGAVLKRTFHAPRVGGLCRNPELRLVQSAHDILNPPASIEVTSSEVYRTPDLDTLKFIHCCPDRKALLNVANSFYAQSAADMGFVVLEIDEECLNSLVEYEAPAHPINPAAPDQNGTVLHVPRMPHIYGPINRSSILRITRAVRDVGDGRFLTV